MSARPVAEDDGFWSKSDKGRPVKMQDGRRDAARAAGAAAVRHVRVVRCQIQGEAAAGRGRAGGGPARTAPGHRGAAGGRGHHGRRRRRPGRRSAGAGAADALGGVLSWRRLQGARGVAVQGPRPARRRRRVRAHARPRGARPARLHDHGETAALPRRGDRAAPEVRAARGG